MGWRAKRVFDGLQGGRGFYYLVHVVLVCLLYAFFLARLSPSSLPVIFMCTNYTDCYIVFEHFDSNYRSLQAASSKNNSKNRKRKN